MPTDVLFIKHEFISNINLGQAADITQLPEEAIIFKQKNIGETDRVPPLQARVFLFSRQYEVTDLHYYYNDNPTTFGSAPDQVIGVFLARK